MGAVAHVLAVNPVPARSQMGSSLGFHIILACFGIAFAAVTMTAGWIGIRRGDAAALLLARRWSKVMAVPVGGRAAAGAGAWCEIGPAWAGGEGPVGGRVGLALPGGGGFVFFVGARRGGLPRVVGRR